MKFTAAALLFAATQAEEFTQVAQPVQTDDNDMKDFVHVVEGVLMGALDAEFGDIEHCIEDGEAVITDVKNAYTHLAAKNAKDVIEGLKDMGEALFEIKKAMSDCKGIVTDFTKLGKMAAEFSNPVTAVVHIGEDLLIHGVDIYHEVHGAINAWEKDPRDYYNFGFNMGKAAAQILLGKEAEEKAAAEEKAKREAETEAIVAKAVEENMFLY